jgi:hypothetical protein
VDGICNSQGGKIMLEELSKLRANLDKYHWAIEAGDPQWKKEEEKWNYYRAKLLIFQTDLKKARNFYYGVLS